MCMAVSRCKRVQAGAACYWLRAPTGYWPNPKGAPTPHISSQAQRIYRDGEMAQRETGHGIKQGIVLCHGGNE